MLKSLILLGPRPHYFPTPFIISQGPGRLGLLGALQLEVPIVRSENLL